MLIRRRLPTFCQIILFISVFWSTSATAGSTLEDIPGINFPHKLHSGFDLPAVSSTYNSSDVDSALISLESALADVQKLDPKIFNVKLMTSDLRQILASLREAKRRSQAWGDK